MEAYLCFGLGPKVPRLCTFGPRPKRHKYASVAKWSNLFPQIHTNQKKNIHIDTYRSTDHGREEVHVPWPSLAPQGTERDMEQAARKCSTWDGTLRGVQGYALLQRPASSCGRGVAEASGRRCLGPDF